MFADISIFQIAGALVVVCCLPIIARRAYMAACQPEEFKAMKQREAANGRHWIL